MAEITKT